MNKLYRTLDLYTSWLVEVDSYNSYGGIKNILGVKVEYNGENLFYSILDNCFFRILPQYDPTRNVLERLQGRLFVEVYDYQNPPFEFKTLGMDLYEKIKREYITKKDLIAFKDFLRGHFSDLDYDLQKAETDIDFRKSKVVEKNIIDTVKQYEEKLGRPITFDSNHIYGPNKKKLLK